MYSRTKQCICLALLVILCAAVICGSAATAREPADSPPALETVMSIKCKTTNPFSEQTPTDNQNIGNDSIACYHDEEGDGYYYGPTDYAIMDSDRFCVMDAENDYIRVYSISKGILINSIDISYCDRPLSICYGNGVYYVYDPDWNRVISYGGDGTMLADIPVPDVGDESDYSSFDEYCSKSVAVFTANLTNNNGEVMLVLGKDGEYVFNDYKLIDGGFVECEPLYTVYTDMSARDSIYPGCDVTECSQTTTVTHEGHSWTFDTFGIGMDVLGVDDKNNLYLFCSVDFVDMHGKILGGASVRVYDAKSNLVRGADLDLSLFPVKHVDMAKMNVNNELFIFAGTTEEIRLMKVNTHKGYKMDTTLIEEALEEYRAAS